MNFIYIVIDPSTALGMTVGRRFAGDDSGWMLLISPKVRTMSFPNVLIGNPLLIRSFDFRQRRASCSCLRQSTYMPSAYLPAAGRRRTKQYDIVKDRVTQMRCKRTGEVSRKNSCFSYIYAKITPYE